VAAFAQLNSLLFVSSLELTVQRDNVLPEVMRWYNDDTQLCTKSIKVSFRGERGDDLGGLTKELFTLIWSDLLVEYFTGELSMVPSLPLHRQIRHRSDFITSGRILAHTTALLGIIPARISQTTLLCIAMGSEELSDEVLLQDFRLVLSNTYLISVTPCLLLS